MRYRYFIKGRLGEREVFPSNDGTLEFTYKKDNNRSDYSRELAGTIILIGEDFKWLYQHELSIHRFELLELTIHKFCHGSWNEEWFNGQVTLNSGEWDLERCKVTLSILQKDKYSCFLINGETKYDIFSTTFIREVLKSVEGRIETETFTATLGPNDPPFDTFPGESSPESKGWTMVELRHTQLPGDEDLAGSYLARWAREEITSSIPLEDSGWIHISGDLYARRPILYDYQEIPYNPNNPRTKGWAYQLLKQDITNGLSLRLVLDGLLRRVCPDLELESDFFQWNPVNPQEENYVTGEKSKVTNLLVFQKTDIKRPFGSGQATKWEVSLKEMLEDLCTLFNLEWEITDDDKLKIEHVSYKNRNPGLNTTDGENERLNRARRKYHYDNSEIPKIEVFKSKDESPYGDFRGEPIIYDSPIAGQEKDEDVYDLNYFTTDLLFCLENSSDKSEVVSDEGLVLVACSENNAVLREDRIKSGNNINNSLAWAQLHRDYWRHNRYMLNFLMNGAQTLALSLKPTKIQEEVRYKLCCASDFDKEGYITTLLGDNGILKSAKFNLYKEMIEMEVAFPAEGTLEENQPPIANDDYAETFKNTPVVVDVLANDVNGDGTIVPSTLNVISASRVSYQITEDFKVRITPNHGVVGEGWIRYNVKDSFGEISNNARVTVEIKEGTSLPVANGGSFSTAKNMEVSKGPGKIFENDTAGTEITAIGESKATDNGGLVVIQPNGAFSYAPASDFVGEDEFQYTIKDNYDNTATGVITITVFEPDHVYVKLVIEETTQDIIEGCADGPIYVGYSTRSNIQVLTFADEFEQEPLDVEGYGLTVKLKREYRDYITQSYDVYNINFKLNEGTAHLYAPSMLTHQLYFGCGYTAEMHFENKFSIEADPAYTIII